jgi:hypothetical protein
MSGLDTRLSGAPDPRERAVRIGNCSGFYGDRLSAMREMLEDGPLDVLTGDWLAELTMLILGKDTMKDPSLGYAKTFLTQLRECLTLALEKGVRIVSNAGGLNPKGLAEAIEALGTGARVAYIDGDDVRGKLPALSGDISPNALTANAYLGAFGIAHALAEGADVVVTGRVTDASVVVGPAIWWHGWGRSDWDALAGAVVAGHVIECGTQVTGGNFSGLFEAIDAGLVADPLQPFGFPIAEIAADGSMVITKHAGTGGLVTVDTVTAQLVYEIQGATYLGPDVTTDLTSITLSQEGPDRVAVSGVRGGPPPARLKAAVNELGGWRNQIEFVLTGLDIERKGELVRAQLDALLPEDVERRWSTFRVPAPDSPTEEGAACLLRIVVWSTDQDKVGKAFTGPAFELVLASIAGFHVTAPPGRPSAYGVYKPAYLDRDLAPETVHLPGGETFVVPPPADFLGEAGLPTTLPAPAPYLGGGETERLPLGTFVHARSGDKGGNCNVGLWVSAESEKASERRAWLHATVTADLVRELLPETEDLQIDLVPLPNLGGLNVVIHGLLGAGVAEGYRFDPQAKAVGEWLISRYVDIPEELL